MHSDALSFHTLQRIFLIVGTVGLVASLLMVWQFGMTMSWKHAVALCCASVVAGFIFPIRKIIADAGAVWTARFLMIMGCFFVGLEFFSHLGYTVGMRTINTTEAMIQTTNLEMRNDAVTEHKTRVDLAKKRLDDLKASNPWMASVSADKLKADIANMEGDMLFARSKQCANVTLKDSRAFCDTIAKLRGQLANIEEFNRETKARDAAQKILDEHREKAIDTKVTPSSVKAQTDFLGKMWNLAHGVEAEKALRPDAVTLTVTDIVVGFFIAIGATLLPTVCFFLAFWKPESQTEANSIQIADHTHTYTINPRPAHTLTTVGEQVRARMAAMALKAA